MSCTIPLQKPVWASLRLAANAPRTSKCSTVCLYAGGGMSNNNNTEGSQWKPIEKAAEKKSIEEILREQIEKKEYAAEPSVIGGGDGDCGRGWGDGDSEGKDMSEALQMTLASIGFVLVYLSTMHRTTSDFCPQEIGQFV